MISFNTLSLSFMNCLVIHRKIAMRFVCECNKMYCQTIFGLSGAAQDGFE